MFRALLACFVGRRLTLAAAPETPQEMAALEAQVAGPAQEQAGTYRGHRRVLTEISGSVIFSMILQRA